MLTHELHRTFLCGAGKNLKNPAPIDMKGDGGPNPSVNELISPFVNVEQCDEDVTRVTRHRWQHSSRLAGDSMVASSMNEQDASRHC